MRPMQPEMQVSTAPAGVGGAAGTTTVVVGGRPVEAGREVRHHRLALSLPPQRHQARARVHLSAIVRTWTRQARGLQKRLGPRRFYECNAMLKVLLLPESPGVFAGPRTNCHACNAMLMNCNLRRSVLRSLCSMICSRSQCARQPTCSRAPLALVTSTTSAPSFPVVRDTIGGPVASRTTCKIVHDCVQIRFQPRSRRLYASCSSAVDIRQALLAAGRLLPNVAQAPDCSRLACTRGLLAGLCCFRRRQEAIWELHLPLCHHMALQQIMLGSCRAPD